MHTDRVVIVALFLLNLLLRLPLTHGFDGLYGQDAYAYYDFARDIVQGDAATTFHWPLGYPLLLASGFTLFGISASVGQVINLALGALLAPMIYLLAREIGLRTPGALLAGLLMTMCGQAIQSSVVVMSDVPALFLATLSAILLARYTHSHSARDLALAALALSLASITRWIYLALALPWLLTVCMTWRGHIRWRHAALAVVVALLVFVPQLLYNLGENPYSWTRWSLDNTLRREFADTQGRLIYPQVNALFFASFLFDPYYLSPIILPLVAVGVWALRKKSEIIVMLFGWLLAPYLFSIGMPQQNIRFLLTSFPVAVILAGAGLDWLVVGARHASPFSSPFIAPFAIATLCILILLLIGFAHTITTSHTVIDTFLTTQRQHQDAVRWAVAQIPPDSTVYTFSITLMLRHTARPLNVYEIYDETPESLVTKWTRGRSDYLLLNVWHVENQWQGHSPQIVYHWLRDQRGLTQLGRHGNYTLFQVRG
jgi:4-amino-4-deoxy-L-arabinose transferase-like glycosyltransferase